MFLRLCEAKLRALVRFIVVIPFRFLNSHYHSAYDKQNDQVREYGHWLPSRIDRLGEGLDKVLGKQQLGSCRLI
jgi:hypothetical protein